MNLELKKLTFSNFLSFGASPTEVSLDDLQNCLVVGNNKDIGNTKLSRNGAGKTTIMQGVVFAMFGKGLDKIKADEFINLKNEKKLLVALDFNVNGVPYRVYRGRKPNRVTLLQYPGEEHEKDLSRDSMGNTDKFLQELIGMNYDLFVGVYFLSPHAKAFMAMGAAEQRSFIEQVLNLDVLAERADALRDIRTKQIKVDLKIVQRDIESATGVNDRVDANVKRIAARLADFDETKQRDIGVQEETLTLAKGIDFDAAENAIAAIAETRETESELKAKLDELKRQHTDLNRDLHSLTRTTQQMRKLRESSENFESDKASALAPIEDALGRMQDEAFYEDQIALMKESRRLQTEVRMGRQTVQATDRELDSLIKQSNAKIEEYEALTNGECPTCGTKDHGPILEEKANKLRDTVHELADQIDSLEERLEAEKAALKANEDAKGEVDDKITSNDPERDLSERRVLASKAEDIRGWTNTYVDQYRSMEAEYGTEKALDDHMTSLLAQADDRDKAERQTREELEGVTAKWKALDEECLDTYGTSDAQELRSFREEVERAEAELKRLHALENPYTEELEAAREQYVDTTEKVAEKEELEKRDTHAQYLIKLLTDSKSFVRKNIVDQYVPFLNKKINEHSQQVGLGHVTEVNADLSVDILYMGKPVSYYLMSQGERMRLNTATTMAFWELMAMLGRSCNLLMVDEMFDSALDPSGCSDMIRFVSGYAENVMMVSHREEFDAYMDRRMEVTKENGFSTVRFADH